MQTSEKSKVREALEAFRGAFVAAGVFSVFINLLMLTVPLYLINVFSHVFGSRSVETLTLLTIVAGGALLLQSSLEMIRGRLLVRVSTELEKKLGHQTLAATVLASAGTSSHNAQPMRDVSELRSVLSGGDIFRLIDIPIIPVFVGVIYLFHPVLAMIALAGTIVLFGLALINEWVTRRPMGQFNELSMKSIGRAEDFIRNADVIRAMGMLPAISSVWHGENVQKFDALIKGSDWSNRLSIVSRFIRMLLQMSMLGMGTYLYIRQEIQPGTIIASSILMARALAPVESAIGTWKNVVSARGAYERLTKLLELNEEHTSQTALPVPEGRLSVENVILTAPGGGNRILLKQVSFGLEPGELLGVIGASGAGKTTLGRALVGVMRPSAGAIRLDGANLVNWNPNELGQYLGYLPQDVQLFSGTVAENIARLDPHANPRDIVDAARRVGVHELILRLPDGYDTRIGEGGMALSAGQKQHIGLARAYYGNPALVVLDEPNANLDANGEMALMTALDQGRSRGITQVVISHRPTILQNADKILLMRDGAVEVFGPAAEVMARFTQKKPDTQQLARAGGDERRSGKVTSLPNYGKWPKK